MLNRRLLALAAGRWPAISVLAAIGLLWWREPCGIDVAGRIKEDVWGLLDKTARARAGLHQRAAPPASSPPSGPKSSRSS